MKRIFVVSIAAFLCTMVQAAPHTKTVAFSPAEINLLVTSLEGDQWSKDQLKKVFSHPTVRKLPNMVSMNVVSPIKLKSETYAHFAEPGAIQRAVDFRSEWQPALATAAEKFHVDEEVILAILLVETNLGTFLGNYRLMNIYPSVFVDSAKIITDGRAPPKLLERATRKRQWALDQLKALLTMNKDRGIDIFNLKGSYAGAIGICQFLPTSYMEHAVSLVKGSADLFKVPDALLSVANYLKHAGYEIGGEDSQKRKAIYAYNHSDVYVDIVLKVAQNLKSSRPRAGSASH